MKKTITIALVLGLFALLAISSPVLAFDPQPEPPGIAVKIYDNPGVTSNPDFTFGALFPISQSDAGGGTIKLPFGHSGFVKGFDPQPEPPGITLR